MTMSEEWKEILQTSIQNIFIIMEQEGLVQYAWDGVNIRRSPNELFTKIEMTKFPRTITDEEGFEINNPWISDIFEGGSYAPGKT